MGTKLNNYNRKKSVHAYMAIEWAFWEKLIAFIIFMMALASLLTEFDLRMFIAFSSHLIIIALLIAIKAKRTTRAYEYLQEYGPLMINHPEYTLVEYSQAVRRDYDTVRREILFMRKKKVIYGGFYTGDNRFVLDGDFNLYYVLRKERWDSAVFVRSINA